MHKKDRKVFATLTDVKNSTGDVFALADEFGEVLITSYNKPRYKISKIGIAEVVDLTPAKKAAKKQKKTEKRVSHKSVINEDELNKFEKAIAEDLKKEADTANSTLPEVKVDTTENKIQEEQSEKPEPKQNNNEVTESGQDELFNISAWDRDNQTEKAFVVNAKQPLIPT